MPGPKTHDIFYRKMKPLLTEKTISGFPNYDDYNLFAQGHDFLIYHKFYQITNQEKLDDNVNNSVLLQEYKIQEFIYNYLKNAQNNGKLEDENIRAFIGPGYMMHHILDAYTHPQIIYYAGDHTRDPNKETWQHGIVENLLDIYMMEKYEGKNPLTYKVYRDFKTKDHVITEELLEMIDQSIEETYQIESTKEIFREAFPQTKLFMRTLKYDPTGIKRVIFDQLDPKLKGTKAFSYNRDYEEVLPYLNLEHEEWLNPMDETVKSTDSFFDLFDKALEDGAHIINDLESLCQSGTIKKDDIYSIIPDVSSTHGLKSGQKIKILNTKQW